MHQQGMTTVWKLMLVLLNCDHQYLRETEEKRINVHEMMKVRCKAGTRASSQEDWEWEKDL